MFLELNFIDNYNSLLYSSQEQIIVILDVFVTKV